MSLFAAYEPLEGGGVPPEDLAIRLATADDVQAIARLAAERNSKPFEEAHTTLRTEFTRIDPVEPQKMFCVAESEGEVVGFARAAYLPVAEAEGAHGMQDGWYLMGVVVGPSYRRRGIGRRLTKYRLEWIRSRANSVYYFVNATNLASVALHRAFGFREVTREFSYPRVTFTGGVGILFSLP
jgi:ribosomal protein S18 acetylase RimI-like enzyme